MDQLSSNEIINLILSVFPPLSSDHYMGILIDIPKNPGNDSPSWKSRRELVKQWYEILKENIDSLNLEGVRLIAYPDVGSNNADIPSSVYLIGDKVPSNASELEKIGTPIDLDDIYRDTEIFLAPTQYSTTAPLKKAAKLYGFRAATMPGFTAAMIPALKVDYEEVNNRVLLLQDKLDQALGAEVRFNIDESQEFKMSFDLRFRTSHASTGRFPEQGMAGNLPSGEAYIVPYEGEKEGEPSYTEGILPVQIGDDIVLYEIKENLAVNIVGEGLSVQEERQHLQKEPAYGNMAELGFGVLGEFGLKPIGEILLDEKLGFHVAFGRSDHFGGAVGPGDFSSPEAVIHLDRIYIPATQPRIQVRSLTLVYSHNKNEIVISDGKYLIF
ncbi:MAG: hypothetical protein JXB26_10665 [Candidatus Aminicenantes bacterium]|nr:hypothetical protein [Candidatus Aminicenantes bacterium]